MTPESQRIAIAEACGWKHNFCERGDGMEVSIWRDSKEVIRPLPDYLNDLNAMHEAEKMLFASKPGYYERSWYGALVLAVTGIDPYECGWGDIDTRQHSDTSRATAAQRAEAFLRAKGLWVEEGVEVSG